MDNTSFDTFSLEEIASDLSEAQRFGDLLEQQGLLKAPANLKASEPPGGCPADRQRQPPLQKNRADPLQLKGLSRRGLLHRGDRDRAVKGQGPCSPSSYGSL